MPEYEFDIQFNYREANVTIWFYDKLQAFAYRNQSGSRCQLSANGGLITLPHLSGLDYIRCSDHTNDLIFVFHDEDAAIEWKKDLSLVTRDHKEVRIKRRWKVGELDKALKLNRSELNRSDSKGEQVREPKGRDADIRVASGSSRRPEP